MEKLVEIMSMHGRFEWFGRMYLRHGHRVGFIAASDDHLSHPGYPTPLAGGLADSGGLAAVMAPEKTSDAIFDAMRNLRTYATTGGRIILEFTVNGAGMGRKTSLAAKRRCRGRVIGTAPIESIVLVKNGEDTWSQDFVSSQSSSPRFVDVRFWSTSDPAIRDSPRGWRQWRGTLDVKGARLRGISTPSFYNRRAEEAAIDSQDSNRVRFKTITRGSFKSVVLDLEGADEKTSIKVKLRPSVERPSTPARFRQPARLPGETFQLRFRDFRNGWVIRRLKPVDRHVDTVTLRAIEPEAPSEQTFEYVDESPPEHGDYYYVRVRQLDGSMAWSSPIWVGGFAPR